MASITIGLELAQIFFYRFPGVLTCFFHKKIRGEPCFLSHWEKLTKDRAGYLFK